MGIGWVSNCSGMGDDRCAIFSGTAMNDRSMYPVRCCRGTAAFDAWWDVDDVDGVVNVWSDAIGDGGFVSDDVSVDDSEDSTDVLVVVIEFVAAAL
jgi:hypothetical protein